VNSLKRDINPMPQFVREALEQRDLISAYLARPPYQQNDYLGWISGAKRKDTQDRRLDQMLQELHQGDAYMGMSYRARVNNKHAFLTSKRPL
jgi:uncharacterized protein YdeI (YjbR/CyaY-like superfamily)